MNIVVDASVIVAALVDSGTHGQWAERVLEENVALAPELALAEATNILRRLERAQQVESREANAAFEDLMQARLELFGFEPFARRVWELRDNVTSYDAWYVALAENLGIPLATLDKRLAVAPGPRCDFLTP